MRKSIIIAFILCTASLVGLGSGVFAAQQNFNGTPTWQINPFNDSEEILVHTRLADYLFSARGGTLRSVYLNFNPVGTPPSELIPDTETRINSSTGQLERSYARDSLFPFELEAEGSPTGELLYEFDQPEETLDNKLIIRFTTEINGLHISKVFALSENPNYSVDFLLEIENLSGSSASLNQGLRLTLGHGLGRTQADENSVRFLFGSEVGKLALNAPGFNGLGFMNGGLVFFLRPLSDNPVYPFDNRMADLGIELGVEIPPVHLAPGENRAYPFLLYAGREKYTLLEHVGLGALSPPGFFSQFIIAVVQLLDWLYSITGNYGWAIILFTIIIRILLFPLTRKQFQSTVKMGAIRPKMEKIQQRYPTMRRLKELHPTMSQEELFKRDRENRRAMQEKMMELYRSEGFNPMGGCLPMLLQFPILIILWQAILYSAEAIHFSPGFLWIEDLALHDPTYILVALTAAAMILQTKTTPQMSTPQQGTPNPMVFMTISIGLMVILLKDFPAGLWLYYFLTTLIQVIQQIIINWEMGRSAGQKPAMAASAGGGDPKEVGAKTISSNGEEEKAT